MSAIADVAAGALLDAPLAALLAVGIGLGHRAGGGTGAGGGIGAGGGTEWWPGVAAVVSAVGAAAVDAAIGTGSTALVLAPVAALVAAATVAAGAAAMARWRLWWPEQAGADPVGRFASVALPLVAVMALVVAARGDGPVTLASGSTTVRVVGVVVERDAVVAAVLAVTASVAVGVVARRRRWCAPLTVALLAPSLVQRAGRDPRVVLARLAVLAAAVGAMAGVLWARQGAIAPLDAVTLTVAAAEVGVVGGLGSVPGALGAAVVLSLVRAMGDEARPGLGALGVHLLVIVIVVVRRGRIGPWGAAVEPAR